MKVLKSIYKPLGYFFNILNALLLVGNIRVAKRIVRYKLNCNQLVKNGKKYLQIQELGMYIDPVKHFFVLEKLRHLIKLQHSFSCELQQQSGEIFINIENCRYCVNTAEEIEFLYHVFALNIPIYNVILPQGTIVMDVGMYIAGSTLYFANMENVIVVIGYEPFVPTFKSAIKNIDLNPNLKKKIKPFNYALSDKACYKECDYSALIKGCMSTNDSAEYLTAPDDVIKEKIEVRPASEELIKIRKDYPNNYLMMLINCEGSEFEIIRELNSKCLLTHVNMFIIEWHYRSPDEIISALADAGFTVVLRNNVNEKLGFLYAFNQHSGESNGHIPKPLNF